MASAGGRVVGAEVVIGVAVRALGAGEGGSCILRPW